MATGQLSVLPPEIRAMVWKFSLPDDVPEVCIFQKPSIFATSVFSTLVVDTAFPALVHVCRETRYFVFNTKISGIPFRYSDLAGCDTPYRPFRNELDTLLNAHGSGVNHIPTDVDSTVETMASAHNVDDIDAMREVSELSYIVSSFPDLEHLAVRVPAGRMHILQIFIREILHHFLPRLKTVTFVTVQATSDVQVTGTVQATGAGGPLLLPDFQPPEGRCKLHRFSTKEMEHLAIKTRQDDIQNMDDLIASVILGSMKLRAFVDATKAKYQLSLAKKIEIEKNMDSTNGEKIFQDILKRAIDFQAHTFIEYQNGLWNRATARPSEQITHISCLLLDHRHIYPEAFVYRDGAYVAKREIPVLCAAEGQMRFEKLHQEFVKLGLIQEDAHVDDEDEGGDGDDEDDDGDDDA
ncbi:hypothetical protein CGCS363_v010939 [Colletotrichum siamense]|uniref:uncharacterized protein n=1 Tax=Colletotrichum siamense TaxID=690259 RepID=UPI0018733427|nr:uncharacterized protein CGCS363_v010939 [Colletotrichum siamense]KAF5492017.1 hypothetical protein CGCS363_v010939 [Colletotrichum siamense]